MDYFDTFDCQAQCEEYYREYEDLCTKDFYFETANPAQDTEIDFERLFDEF